MKALALLSIWLALPLFAQDAQVVELSKQDAEHARVAYETLKKAQAEWDAIQLKTKEKYLKTDEHSAVLGTTGSDGKTLWLKWPDIVFSEDFKFIVPKEESRPLSGLLSGLKVYPSACFNPVQYNGQRSFYGRDTFPWTQSDLDIIGTSLNTTK